jgi:threonylcarbamoyladenosine tRNA methylthiotransferase MtaB
VRPETPAAKMRGKVPNAVKKERSQHLIQWAVQREAQFAQQYIGQTLPVLWEHVTGASEQGFLQAGYTHNYIRVQTTHPRILSNQITPVIMGTDFKGSIEVTPVIE